MESWIRREALYTGRILSLEVGEVRLENGEVFPREIVRHKGGVAIVPVLDNQVILIRQYRTAIERDILELPAGKLEAGESPQACAQRELGEEIGYQAQKMILAASYFSSVGYSDERMYIYLAFELQPVARHPDADEELSVIHMPLQEAEERLRRHEFEDAKTIIGLRELFAALRAPQD